jgi:guanylate kinase
MKEIKMYKVFALIGPSGCGKDTILKTLLKKYNKTNRFHPIVSYTTRPKREGEKNGVQYRFTDTDTMLDFFAQDDIVEMAEFNGWFYGTTFECYKEDKINIGIFDPTRLEILLANPEVQVTIFYIKAKDNIRLIRQLGREDSPDVDEILRRYKTDKTDFYGIEGEYGDRLTIIPNDNKLNLHSAVLTILFAAGLGQNKKVKYL